MLHRIVAVTAAGLIQGALFSSEAVLPAETVVGADQAPQQFVDEASATARGLLLTRCLPCHDADGPAPIRLDATDAILRHRRLMRALIEDQTMPPRRPESPFAAVDPAHLRPGPLQDRERAMLLAALDSEAAAHAAFDRLPLAATASDRASAAHIVAHGTWRVPAAGAMRIRSFHAEVGLSAPRRVRGWRLPPQQDPSRWPLRFVSLASDPKREWRIAEEGESGAEAMGDVGLAPSGALGALSRAAPEFLLPVGFAFDLPAGDLVIETTVEPIGREAEIRPSIEILAASTGDIRSVEAIAARIVPLAVPGGMRLDRTVHLDIVEDLQLVGIVAKGGVFLRGYAVETVAPDHCRTMIAIERDFRINLTAPVVFREPPRIAKGSVIEVRFDFDNTSSNPLQPFDPPRDLEAGLPPTGEDAVVVLLVSRNGTPAMPGSRP